MKSKYIYIGGIIMCLFLLSGCFNKKIEFNNTKKFSYSYSVGNYMNGSYAYTLELIDGKYIATYKGDGIPEEERLKKEVNKDTVLKLEEILTKHKIYKWNGFKKSDKNVLDGNSFSLTYRKEDDTYISASGYMKYPDGYKEFKTDIINFYNEIFK